MATMACESLPSPSRAQDVVPNTGYQSHAIPLYFLLYVTHANSAGETSIVTKTIAPQTGSKIHRSMTELCWIGSIIRLNDFWIWANSVSCHTPVSDISTPRKIETFVNKLY